MKTSAKALMIGLLGTASWAAQAADVDEDVSKIFDHSQRQLASPPKSLRAKGSATDDTRFQQGVDRVQRRLAANTEDEGNEPAVNADDLKTAGASSAVTDAADTTETKVNAPFIPAAASTSDSRKGKIVIIRENRKEKRQGPLSNYSFDGTRSVGLGLVGGGAYGIFGAELDIGFGAKWSGGFGVGTGMDYSTWGLYARKYFLEGPISTFIQLGYANWSLGSAPARDKVIYPEYLAKLFFGENADGEYKSHKAVHLVYPATGILYQTSSGLAYSLAVQYFINTANFTGALYAGMGMHFYF